MERQRVLNLIKKYIRLNLEDSMHQILTNYKITIFLSKRDTIHLINFMERESEYSLNLMKYLYEKPESIEFLKNRISIIDNAIQDACEENRIDIIKFLLSPETKKKYPLINPRYHRDRALITACSKGYIEIVRFLLSEDVINLFADKYMLFGTGYKIYIYEAIEGAYYSNSIDIIKFLLSSEVKDIVCYNNINGLLRQACSHNNDINYDLAKFLLSPDLHRLHKVTLTYEEINQLFTSACIYGCVNMVKYLLSEDRREDIDHKIDPSFRNNRALEMACEEHQIEIVKILLSVIKVNNSIVLSAIHSVGKYKGAEIKDVLFKALK